MAAEDRLILFEGVSKFYGEVLGVAPDLARRDEAMSYGEAVAETRAALIRSVELRLRAGYGFAPAGRFQLAGFDEPLEVFPLIR